MMPTRRVTRAMKKSNESTKLADNDNHLPNTGVKRKADGRQILGEIGNNAGTNLQNRRILTTRLNNKNVANGSENLRNKRGGLKDGDKDGPLKENIINVNLDKITNTLKRGLSSISSNSKNSASASKTQASEPQKIDKKQIFTNQDSFCTIPISLWREEIRSNLIRKELFFDYEASVKDSPNEAPEFSLGIFEYMRWREERFEMKPYLTPKSSVASDPNRQIQTSFHASDRRCLIDWMVEFQEIQESTHETLYLAVRLCDYYFSHRKVQRDQLQLYAFIGFLLASKFEERWPPLFDDMIQLSDDQYTREDFIMAEENMLKCLNFDINIPISYRYLRRYARCIGMDIGLVGF